GVLPESGFGRAGNLFGQSDDLREPVLRFVRSGWVDAGSGAPRSNLQVVSYVIEDGQLIRRASVRPDAVRSTPVSERIVFNGVDRISLEFVRDGVMSREWIGDAGQSLNVLPDLIEIEITFEDERTLTIAALTGARS
ncbi:MAG: type II secretion system protein GspJ, partial [Pseudomonadota bacterium]